MEYHGDKPSEEERKAGTSLVFAAVVVLVALCLSASLSWLVWSFVN